MGSAELSLSLKKHLKTGIVALATAFGFAAATGSATAAPVNPAPANPVPSSSASDVTFWKTQSLDAVIRIENGPDGARSELYWMNPKDTKIFDYFGDKTGRDAGSAVTESDVKGLCGFSPKLDFKAAGEQRWRGTMELRGMGMEVNVEATRLNDRQMRVDTSKFIIRQSETWTRIDAGDPRYPACRKPGP
jgi:hypothetical protein